MILWIFFDRSVLDTLGPLAVYEASVLEISSSVAALQPVPTNDQHLQTSSNESHRQGRASPRHNLVKGCSGQFTHTILLPRAGCVGGLQLPLRDLEEAGPEPRPSLKL